MDSKRKAMQLKRSENGTVEIVSGKRTAITIRKTADGVTLTDNIQHMSALYCVPQAQKNSVIESIIRRLQAAYGTFTEVPREEN